MSLFFNRRPHHTVTWVIFIAILIFAFAVRIYHIDTLPLGIYPDESANGVDALQALETHDFKLFYPANYGREGLFINLQAITIHLLGNTILGLKLWSILFGTLSVLGMYLLSVELFRRRISGLISAFMLATSYWAINFSRIGFRAIMMTFILTFSFYFFFRGLRTRRFRYFLFSGLIFGLGLHTYIAFRVAPFILILLLPALILSYENFFKRYYKHALLFILGAFISALPMLYDFFVAHPEDFGSRSEAVSIFSPSINHGNLLGTFTRAFSLSLIKYNFFGDQNWRHNYAPYPILDPFVGTFFLAGFLFVFFQTLHLISLRIRYQDRDLRLVVNIFLLGSFFIMLIPEFLSGEGLPHALRSIGTQMPVFLMATLPVVWLYKKAKKSQRGLQIALFSILLFALGSSAVFNLTKYFVFFAHNTSASGSFNENYTNMARYLLSLPPETKKYVLFDEKGNEDLTKLPVYAHPVYYLTYHKVPNMEIIKGDTVLQGPAIFLMVNYNNDIEARIRKIFPTLEVKRIDINGPRTGGD
ncbi:MAG: hypothetical protein COW50_02795, partial [Candidatus Moranbacteria bacterium CG17_big_fil_post_rev_8_21_14_2_50_41_107]